MDIVDILEGCKKQDQICQENLYRQFYPVLFSLCKRFFKENHEILTALNNGMLKVFNNINKYDASKGDLFTWVYTIVRNAALTLLSNKKDNCTRELTDFDYTSSSTNPFKILEWKDIYFFLDKLPPKTRCVCSLFYIEDFAIKEIAESLKMKEGAVKWHLSESRSRLKVIFEQYPFENAN